MGRPYIGNFTTFDSSRSKKLDGKVHIYLYNFSYWYFPITVCASEFQS
jgi:hypothetical protein